MARLTSPDAGTFDAGHSRRARLRRSRHQLAPRSEEDRRSAEHTRRSPGEVSRLVRHRALVAVAGRIGQHRQFAGPAGRSAVGRHPEPQQRAGAELGSRQVDQESRSVGR